LFETLFADVRQGARALAKTPLVTAVAMVALMLGIGATTAIFSVINAVLIHPLGGANTDRLVIIYATNPKGVAEYPGQADYFDWRDQAHSYETMLAWRGRPFTLTGLEQPSFVYAHRVSAGFFELLGLKPAIGRTFSIDDYKASSPRVTVLTNKLWLRQFAGDPKIIGRSITLDNELYTVIGLMPAGDFQLFASARPELWVPLQLDAREKSGRRTQILGALARLRRGITVPQAQAEMNVIAARIASQYPETNKGWGAKVNLAAEDLVADIRPTFLVLMGAVILVLLIACANVANLQLARAASRQKEIAVRAALGSGRARIIRQMLTESLLLGAAGGVLGVLFAYWSTKPLAGLVPEMAAYAGAYAGVGNIQVDRSVLGFSLLVSVVTSILFGLVPALQASRLDMSAALNEGGRGSSAGPSSGRLRRLLVVSEVTLALVLLIAAGLMLRSFQNLQEVDPGFRPDHVLTMGIPLPGNRYPPEKAQMFFDELGRRIDALPGVISSGMTNAVPLRFGDFTVAFTIDGVPAPAPGTEPRASLHLASPGYFATMGIALVQGRFFSDRDSKDSPRVAVVSSAMARRSWPGENPIGKRIRVLIFRLPETNAALTIVGVAGDVRSQGLAIAPEPAMYFPQAQYPGSYAVFAVRTASNPRSLVSSLQKQVWALDRNQAVLEVTPMSDIVSNSLWQLRFSMALLSIFGAIALILAACGIYAVLSYSVRQRTREIGLRMALGSTSGGVQRLVLADALKLALMGVAIGLGSSFVLNRLLSRWLEGAGATQTVNKWLPSGQRGLLYGVSPSDPLTFAVIAAALVVTALAASYPPARRASRMDPMTVLRME
jgi:putative ABC transport system permease protein